VKSWKDSAGRLVSRVPVGVLAAMLWAGVSLSGCGGPELSSGDLGEIQTDREKLPGADDEHILPPPKFKTEELEPPSP